MDVDPRAAAAKRKREKERLQVRHRGGGGGCRTDDGGFERRREGVGACPYLVDSSACVDAQCDPLSRFPRGLTSTSPRPHINIERLKAEDRHALSLTCLHTNPFPPPSLTPPPPPPTPHLRAQTNIERLKAEQEAQEERHAAVMASPKASCGSWFAEQARALCSPPTRPLSRAPPSLPQSIVRVLVRRAGKPFAMAYTLPPPTTANASKTTTPTHEHTARPRPCRRRSIFLARHLPLHLTPPCPPF
jgi:hypothetical protein